jgi:predicted transcriptional regulator YdeE
MSQIHHKTLHTPLLVAGIQIRTSNAAEIDGAGQIGPLWQRFFAENLASQIPNRTGEGLAVVYSNYQSDENGAYDYLLGAPVDSIDHLPAIPTGEYAVVTTEKGPLVEVLQSAWRHIWNLAPTELGGQRAFLADYEIYDHRSQDPADAQIEIHIGLAPAAPANPLP